MDGKKKLLGFVRDGIPLWKDRVVVFEMRSPLGASLSLVSYCSIAALAKTRSALNEEAGGRKEDEEYYSWRKRISAEARTFTHTSR